MSVSGHPGKPREIDSTEFIAAASSLRPATARLVQNAAVPGQQADSAASAVTHITAAEFIGSGEGARAERAQFVNEAITAAEFIASGKASRAEQGRFVNSPDFTAAGKRSRRERARFLNR